MARKTERLQVSLDIGLRREIEAAAREQDTSLSQIVRQAIRDWAVRRQVESRNSLSSRAFSIAMTACAAKFCSKAICLSVNGRTSCR
jgi:metal-responsive CopG/Arc/MetJ family transcriptional regulator